MTAMTARRPLFVHVGLQKTGTSYLQDVLFRNQSVLREHDILYPADRFDALTTDAASETSRHDMGGDIIPAFVNSGDAQVYDFMSNEVPGTTDRDRAYWRDVGSIDSYYEANRDLIALEPVFNLYNTQWPIFTSIAASAAGYSTALPDAPKASSRSRIRMGTSFTCPAQRAGASASSTETRPPNRHRPFSGRCATPNPATPSAGRGWRRPPRPTPTPAPRSASAPSPRPIPAKSWR